MVTFFSGYLLSLGLIVAIGAQNAFVLRQGLRRSHVFAVCLFCGVSDAVLILAGVAGFGALIDAAPAIVPILRYGGAAFLIWYGWRSARSALAGGQMLDASGEEEQNLGRVLATLAAFTWLNPHVYLDTVVMLGNTAQQSEAPWVFGIGAAAGSMSFFFALGYGARALTPVFANPRAWQILDGGIALVMWTIAYWLLAQG